MEVDIVKKQQEQLQQLMKEFQEGRKQGDREVPHEKDHVKTLPSPPTVIISPRLKGGVDVVQQVRQMNLSVYTVEAVREWCEDIREEVYTHYDGLAALYLLLDR